MNERIDIADNTGDPRDQDHGEASDDLESLTMSETVEKDCGSKKKQKKPFLFRVWRFLQTTATEVIKGDSKFSNIKPSLHFSYATNFSSESANSFCS